MMGGLELVESRGFLVRKLLEEDGNDFFMVMSAVRGSDMYLPNVKHIFTARLRWWLSRDFGSSAVVPGTRDVGWVEDAKIDLVAEELSKLEDEEMIKE